MATKTFYGVVQPVLAAGSYTGTTPKILEEGRESRKLASDYGIMLENGNSSEIGSDYQGTILYEKLAGIIHAWAQKQTNLDTLEQNIKDILKASSLSFEIIDKGYEINNNNYELMLQVEVLT